MTNNVARLLSVLTLFAAVVAGAGWSEAHSELRACRLDELASIAALLKEEQELLRALQSDAAKEQESGILGSYLAAIRADGVAKHADRKQRLDQLAENNSAILALLNVYLPHAKTAVFSAETQRFQRYAVAWRDRWNSVMELFMAGGNYPVAEVPFPGGFPAVVDKEIAAAQ
jgi:hypothetical protein